MCADPPLRNFGTYVLEHLVQQSANLFPVLLGGVGDWATCTGVLQKHEREEERAGVHHVVAVASSDVAEANRMLLTRSHLTHRTQRRSAQLATHCVLTLRESTWYTFQLDASYTSRTPYARTVYVL